MSESAEDVVLVITRFFTAPRERVWAAFSEAERFAQWWGPTGFSLKVPRFEFRAGGVCHYQMVSSDGRSMWGRFEYREIAAPERIEFLNGFSDEQGGLIRSPFGGEWPLEVLNTITLHEEDGRTRLTLRAAPFGATEAERQAFGQLHVSMQGGYGGSFDKLDASLATAEQG